MSKKAIVIMLVSVLVVTAGVALVAISKDDKAEQRMVDVSESKFEDKKTGLSLKYRAPLSQGELSTQDELDKIVLRLTSFEPAMLVSTRYEDGLRSITAISRQETMTLLLGNAEKSHPSRFPGYVKQSEQLFEVAGKKAAELYFTYKGPSGELVKQRLLIIIKDEDTAVYLSAQSKENDFNKLNSEYFDSLLSSVSFN